MKEIKVNRVETTGKPPRVVDLWATLYELLEDQEGREILYTVTDIYGNVRTNRKETR